MACPDLLSLSVLRRLPYAQRLAVSSVLCLAVATVTRTTHRYLAPGLRRLSVCLPCITVLLFIPTLFDGTSNDELLTCLVLLAVVGWWATTRVLLVALGRAPLSRQLSLRSYAAELLLPVNTQRTAAGGGSHRTAGQLTLRFGVKLCLLAAACTALVSTDSRFHVPLVRHALYAIGMYAFLGALGDGPGAVMSSVVGVRLSPHFNNPFISASCADFWGSRWNVTAAYLLRKSVYEPIMQGSLVGTDVDAGQSSVVATPVKKRVTWKPSITRRAIAVCATFLASGIAHELILHQVSGSEMTGEWLLFFALQGPLLCAEALLKPLLPRSRLLITPCSLLVLLLIGGQLFFPVAVRTGLDTRVVGAIMHNAKGVSAAFDSWLAI